MGQASVYPFLLAASELEFSPQLSLTAFLWYDFYEQISTGAGDKSSHYIVIYSHLLSKAIIGIVLKHIRSHTKRPKVKNKKMLVN